MIEMLEGYYAYWLCFLVLTLGLYGMLVKRNLVKKVIGLSLFQTAIILFFIIAAYKDGATVPVVEPRVGETAVAAAYINPLPHTLMLTAIVVGVATLGVAFALMIRIYEGYGTLDEDTLGERMKK
jgi:multicomponent Na+:H+ antiporter subunit C